MECNLETAAIFVPKYRVRGPLGKSRINFPSLRAFASLFLLLRGTHASADLSLSLQNVIRLDTLRLRSGQPRLLMDKANFCLPIQSHRKR